MQGEEAVDLIKDARPDLKKVIIVREVGSGAFKSHHQCALRMQSCEESLPGITRSIASKRIVGIIVVQIGNAASSLHWCDKCSEACKWQISQLLIHGVIGVDEDFILVLCCRFIVTTAAAGAAFECGSMFLTSASSSPSTPDKLAGKVVSTPSAIRAGFHQRRNAPPNCVHPALSTAVPLRQALMYTSTVACKSVLCDMHCRALW